MFLNNNYDKDIGRGLFSSFMNKNAFGAFIHFTHYTNL